MRTMSQLQDFYPCPRRFRYGTAVELRVLDALYLLASLPPLQRVVRDPRSLQAFAAQFQGRLEEASQALVKDIEEEYPPGAFEITVTELARLAGVSRKEASRALAAFVRQGLLRRDDSWTYLCWPNARVYALPNYGNFHKEEYFWKPHGYLQHGWHELLGTAIRLRLLNFFLSEPPGRRYRLGHRDVQMLSRATTRTLIVDEGNPTVENPPAPAEIVRSLRLFLGLGLLKRVGQYYLFDPAALQHPPPANIEAMVPVSEADVRAALQNARDVDAEHVARTLALLYRGNLSVGQAAAIYHSVRGLRDYQFERLLHKAERYRDSYLDQAQKWRYVWRSFHRHDLHRFESSRVRAFFQPGESAVQSEINLPAELRELPFVQSHLVCRLCMPRTVVAAGQPRVPDEREVTVDLYQGATQVYRKRLILLSTGQPQRDSLGCLDLRRPLRLVLVCEKPLKAGFVELWAEFHAGGSGRSSPVTTRRSAQ